MTYDQTDIIYKGDLLDWLPKLPDQFVNCIVTSPPYWGLRDYKISESFFPKISYAPLPGMEEIIIPAWQGCLGLEPTIEMFIGHIVGIFREASRVLKEDGTCWINMGDSYANNNPVGGHGKNKRNAGELRLAPKKSPGLRPKDLCGIPWRMALALQADGWYLRQDIIWDKPNPMPESVKDRCTKSHEYIFLITKSKKYYFNAFAIAEPYKDKTFTAFGSENKKGNGDGSGMVASENWHNTIKVRKPKDWKIPRPAGWHDEDHTKGNFDRERRDEASSYGINGKGFIGHSGNHDKDGNLIGNGFANKRSVWRISTQAFSGAHFATFPEKLPTLCIKAGCPPDGIVMDIFAGAGTTLLVASKMNIRSIGIEISRKYIFDIMMPRLQSALGLFNFFKVVEE